MNNWRTSAGGAIGVFGTTLAGGAVVLHMMEYQGRYVVPMAIIGFVFSALGRAVVAFFAVDAQRMKLLEDKVSGTDLFKKGSA